MKTSTEPDDPELARRAAAGDDRAYVLLIRRHKDHLQRLLLRYLGDPVEAGEAVQEAFVAAWSALGRYDPNRPFGAWLRTIAINKARDRGRRMAVRRMIFGNRALDEGGAYQHPDPQPDAEAVLVERERLAILDRAISRLPAPLKEALLLTVIEGYSQQEAASILGVTVKAIETRVYRARKRLAELMDRSAATGS